MKRILSIGVLAATLACAGLAGKSKAFDCGPNNPPTGGCPSAWVFQGCEEVPGSDGAMVEVYSCPDLEIQVRRPVW